MGLTCRGRGGRGRAGHYVLGSNFLFKYVTRHGLGWVRMGRNGVRMVRMGEV